MNPHSRSFDVAVIGAGLIGLATARALLARDPTLRLAVLEKEAAVARHQSSHNSGVIHMGIYYRPGSLKARLAVEGAAAMKAYCRERGIPVDPVGKVIVALDETELPALDELERRGIANGVPGLRRVSMEELREIEPEAAGIAALHSPQTAIVNYAEVAQTLAAELLSAGVEVLLGTPVLGGSTEAHGASIRTPNGTLTVGRIVNCAGLYADVVARRLGAHPGVQIVPFRGEYYLLRADRAHLVRGLIYPTPDPRLPFLGVHFTRTVEGGVEAGPNAVPALAREGYAWSTVDLRELAETLRYAGYRRMARTHWRTGVYEIVRSLRPSEFVRSLQRLVPAITRGDLVRGGAGVRAQAIAPDGSLADDFAIVQEGCAVHVLNAPSPAATASLAIGEHIAGLALAEGGLSAPLLVP
jgi:L-2-hydroxyglutarate oxidase LhgO